MTLNEDLEPISSVESQKREGEAEVDFAEKEEYIPQGRYDGVLFAVYKNAAVSRTLKAISTLSVALCMIIFATALVFYGISDWRIPVKLAVVTGAPFIIVTLFRRLLNFPRPYEVFSFYEHAPRRKRGQSFPSRHVFSIFVIGASLCFVNVGVGLALMLVGLTLAVSRVLLGIHFIRDVVAGGLIGVVSGVIGMLIANGIF